MSFKPESIETAPGVLNDRQLRFCQEYVIDLNATRAAAAAGFSTRTASSAGSRLLRNVKVQEKIWELQDEIARDLKLQASTVVQRLRDIAFADPQELTAVVRGACRHCHGKDHHFQYRIAQEFQRDMAAWLALSDARRARIPAPSDAGGYRYSEKADPHPGCPMCDGDGILRIRYGDTSNLSQSARVLFAGVKETSFGLEILMHDRFRALDLLARHLGLFAKKTGRKQETDLQALVRQINKRGKVAPIHKIPEPRPQH